MDLCVSVVKFSENDPAQRHGNRTGEKKRMTFYNDTVCDEALPNGRASDTSAERVSEARA